MSRGTPNRPPTRATLGPYSNSIRRYRLRAGLTQGALADRVGVRWHTVTLWERGWRLPGLQNLLRLARALDTLGESLFWNLYAPRSPRAPDVGDHPFPLAHGSEPADTPTQGAAGRLRQRFWPGTRFQRAIAQARFYTAVAREVRARRIAAGLTRETLGKRVRLPAVGVARIEEDDYRHGSALQLLLRIAAALDCTLEVRLLPAGRRIVRGRLPRPRR